MHDYVLITYVSIPSSLLVSFSQLSVYETSVPVDETGHHPNVHYPCASLLSLRAYY